MIAVIAWTIGCIIFGAILGYLFGKLVFDVREDEHYTDRDYTHRGDEGDGP